MGHYAGSFLKCTKVRDNENLRKNKWIPML
jgi:hypothetical protein